MEAVRRGADELWIIWTVSERAVWNDGFIANYFQVIETTANGHFRQDLQRIEANNAAIAAGEVGEFGRLIEIKILRAEVPSLKATSTVKDGQDEQASKNLNPINLSKNHD